MWTHAFKSHTRALQHALEIGFGFLPQLDIFSPIDNETSTLYFKSAEAWEYPRQGDEYFTLKSIESVTKASKRAGLPPPDLGHVLQTCLEVKAREEAESAAVSGQIGVTQTLSWLRTTNIQVQIAPQLK